MIPGQMAEQVLQWKDPPGPKGHKLLGMIPQLRSRDIRLLAKYVSEYGDVILFKVGPRILYFLNNPDDIKHILQTNAQNYAKETRAWDMLRVLLGPSVLTTAGELWKKRRRLMQPLFNPPALASIFPMMNRIIGETVEDFYKREAKGKPLEIRWEMLRIALRIIGETIMGEDVDKYVDEVGKALTTVLDYTAESYSNLYNAPLFIPTQRNIKFRKALGTLNDIVYQLIAKRRKSTRHPEDLLTRLMEATDTEDGKHLTDSEIRDEIMTMFLAGHETTASSLSWIWILLAQNPEVDDRLFQELASQPKSQVSTREELIKLKYTYQVMEEALRLYPPIFLTSRSAEADDEIGGYRIPAKATVFFSMYILHHDPRYWSDPEKFDPERFSHEEKKKIQPYTYLPFIEGPRKCLGYHFAMIEVPLVISTIARNFRLRLVANQKIEPSFSVALRPKEGILMTLEKR